VSLATLGRSTATRSRATAASAALLALLAALLGSAALAAPARAVPVDFWGAVPQSAVTPAQFERLKRGGVDSIRFAIDWTAMQPSPRSEINWGAIDGMVGGLAEAHLKALPFLYGAPRWAVRQRAVPGTGGGAKAVARLPVAGRAGSGWSAFVRGAVERYGPRGTFWTENPDVPRDPIHTWQIWNEPNFKYFVARPNPAEYGRLVKRSARAIHAADLGATIVLGGLFARPGEAGKFHPPRAFTAVEFLETMFKRTPGVAASFDGVALHPYTTSYTLLPGEIEEVRRLLRVRHAASKGLWLTEIGWSSEPPSRRDAFAKGLHGQATQLTGAFKLFRANWARWRLHQVYWFSVDDLPNACNFCGGSGLFRKGFRPKPAWRSFVRFAGGVAG
jgi:polysaccharide biosynthesis protein PslG